MRPKRVSVDFKAWPASAKILSQPLGVIGILAPWNYPIQLSLSPLVAAIAAGNHVCLKPSEHTPRTSALLASILEKVFPASRVQVIQGDASVAQAFASLPFDHLLYTGSSSVGKLVMQAAAKNLTPVTLELGGKSPTIIAPDFPIARAATRIAVMKHLNAGQTCIAPDYVFIAKHKLDEFISAYRAEIAKMYPNIASNPDYTSIVNARQYERLQAILADARAQGAVVETIEPGGACDPESRVLAPTLVCNATDDMRIMQEEIFGPVLPVLSYERFEDATDYVRKHPRPLAFYLFDERSERVNHVLAHLSAGGVTINDCALHITQHELPFGGIGPSGMGHYHGHAGFLTFTKQMPVFQQARWSGFWLLKPPYKQLADRAVKFLTGR
jgi:coniferyl-aldehyde dehydrogenase